MLRLVYNEIKGYLINPKSIFDEGNHFNIILLGDSLVNRSCERFNFISKINRSIIFKSKYGFSNFGHNGDTILKIKNRIDVVLSAIRDISKNRQSYSVPINVFLFWDTDCSDVDELHLSIEDRNTLRKNYEDTLKYVISSLTDAGASVTVCSPGLLGPVEKNRMLDDYSRINERVSLESNATFLNVRQPLQELFESGISPTTDGEHLNGIGVRCVAKLFASVIDSWTSDIVRNTHQNVVSVADISVDF